MLIGICTQFLPAPVPASRQHIRVASCSTLSIYLKVVEYLENNPKVAKVNHPAVPSHPDHELYKKLFPNGGGSIFTFDIKGGEKEAWEFIDHLRIFSLLANVADVKSLVIHPATTTHSQLSPEELEEQHIYPSTVRLSIGIENIDDLIEALDEAFTYVK